MKDDRKLLAKHLDELGLDPARRARVLMAPSKASTNGKFISRFIEEVGRNRETSTAVKGKGPRPTGNWLHIFKTFQEVIDPIQLQIFAGEPIEDAAMRRLLRQELQEILRKCLVAPKKTGKAFSPAAAIHDFYQRLPEPLTLKNVTTSRVHTASYRHLLALWIHTMQTKFFPQILPEAVRSTAFLDFDPTSGEMVEQPVHEALLQLQIELQGFRQKGFIRNPEGVVKIFPRNVSQSLSLSTV